jgi:hypothetical protein
VVETWELCTNWTQISPLVSWLYAALLHMEEAKSEPWKNSCTLLYIPSQHSSTTRLHEMKLSKVSGPLRPCGARTKVGILISKVDPLFVANWIKMDFDSRAFHFNATIWKPSVQACLILKSIYKFEFWHYSTVGSDPFYGQTNGQNIPQIATLDTYYFNHCDALPTIVVVKVVYQNINI